MKRILVFGGLGLSGAPGSTAIEASEVDIVDDLSGTAIPPDKLVPEPTNGLA